MALAHLSHPLRRIVRNGNPIHILLRQSPSGHCGLAKPVQEAAPEIGTDKDRLPSPGPPRPAARHLRQKKGALRPCQIFARLRSCALMATTTVLADMSTAPTAGVRRIPQADSTPAASGIATML